MFYDDEMICDTADPSFLMDLYQAGQFASKTYNNEVLYFKKAFPIICQSLRPEWEVDVVDALIDGGSERLVMLMRISSKSDRKELSYGGCGNVSDCNL